MGHEGEVDEGEALPDRLGVIAFGQDLWIVHQLDAVQGRARHRRAGAPAAVDHLPLRDPPLQDAVQAALAHGAPQQEGVAAGGEHQPYLGERVLQEPGPAEIGPEIQIESLNPMLAEVRRRIEHGAGVDSARELGQEVRGVGDHRRLGARPQESDELLEPRAHAFGGEIKPHPHLLDQPASPQRPNARVRGRKARGRRA